MSRKTNLLCSMIDRICELIAEGTDLFIAERPALRKKARIEKMPDLKQKKEENLIALNQAFDLIKKQINQNRLDEKIAIFTK